MLVPICTPPVQDYSLSEKFSQIPFEVSKYVTVAGPHRFTGLNLPQRKYSDEVSLVMSEFASRLVTMQRIHDIEKLETDWDGHGAEQVCAACVNNARKIADLLPTFALSPDIFPNPNGTITLEWENARGTLSIEIGESGISGFFDTHTGPLFFQEDYDGGIPAFVESALRKMEPILSGGDLIATSVTNSYVGHGNFTHRYI